MISMRKIVACLVLFAALAQGLTIMTPVGAETKCRMGPQGQFCISEVDFKSFAQNTYRNQEASQWCWAACISMVVMVP
jgi:hypothetical protein